MSHSLTERSGDDISSFAPKGSAPGLMATIAGESQFAFDYPNTSAPFVDSGRLRALLVLGRRRVPLFPGVPSAAEVGLPQLDLPSWGGFCAPMATPPQIIDRLNTEIRKVLTLPALRDKPWPARSRPARRPSR